jgi:hypothetical protein
MPPRMLWNICPTTGYCRLALNQRAALLSFFFMPVFCLSGCDTFPLGVSTLNRFRRTRCCMQSNFILFCSSHQHCNMCLERKLFYRPRVRFQAHRKNCRNILNSNQEEGLGLLDANLVRLVHHGVVHGCGPHYLRS